MTEKPEFNLSLQFIIYSLGNILKKTLSFFLLPIYTHALSPAEYGIVDILMTGAGFFIAFLNLGLKQAVLFYYFEEKPPEQKRMLFSLLIFRLFFLLPFFFLSFYSEQLSIVFFNHKEYAWAIFATCLLIPVSMIFDDQKTILQINGKSVTYNALLVIRTITNFGAGAILVGLFQFNVFGVQLASLLSFSFMAIMSIILNRRFIAFSLDTQVLQKLLRFGIKFLPALLSSWLLLTADRFLLVFIAGKDSLGIYSVANTIVSPLVVIFTAIQLSTTPEFWKLYHNKKDVKKNNSKDFFRRVFYSYFVMACLLFLFVVFFGREITNLLMPEAYGNASTLLPILFGGLMIFHMSQFYQVGFIIKNKVWKLSLISFLFFIINLILNLHFIPKYQEIASAVIILFTYIMLFVGNTYYSQKYFHIKQKHWRFLSITIVFTGLGVIVNKYFSENDLWLKVLAFIVLFWLIIIINRKKVFYLIKWMLKIHKSQKEKKHNNSCTETKS